MRQVVPSRIKIPVTKKKRVVKVPVPKTQRVVINAPKRNQKARQQAAAAAAPPPAAPPKKPVGRQAVSVVRNKKGFIGRQRKGRLSRNKVEYVSKNLTPENLVKINKIRGIGKGKILVIIGNGPSILEANLGDLRGAYNVETMSINKPDDRIWPTDYWAFFDPSQMRRHESYWNNYEGYCFNSSSIKRQRAKSMQFKNQGGKGFSREANRHIFIGRSSVYAAMQIAYWMEHEEIYIFGCDMNENGIDGKLHFYGVNPDVEPDIRRGRFKNEAIHYDTAAKMLTDEERERYVFCTEYNPWDFIHKFRNMSHRDAVDHIAKRALEL